MTMVLLRVRLMRSGDGGELRASWDEIDRVLGSLGRSNEPLLGAGGWEEGLVELRRL